MLTPYHQTSLFGSDLLLQLDPRDPLLKLSDVIPWKLFDDEFAKYYCRDNGVLRKLMRLMVGLLILKQFENLSDESVVLQWKPNPYYQAFCGMTKFQLNSPCDNTELVKNWQRRD